MRYAKWREASKKIQSLNNKIIFWTIFKHITKLHKKFSGRHEKLFILGLGNAQHIIFSLKTTWAKQTSLRLKKRYTFTFEQSFYLREITILLKNCRMYF